MAILATTPRGRRAWRSSFSWGGCLAVDVAKNPAPDAVVPALVLFAGGHFRSPFRVR